jgi:cyclohexanone monooxygenase
VPANNHVMSAEYEQGFKQDYRTKRQEALDAPFGILMGDPVETPALEVSDEERMARYSELWNKGGLSFLGAFPDIILDEDANETAAEFIRAKVREKVTDPDTAELLCPKDYPAGAKRLCVDTGYFEAFNKDSVELIDINSEPIERITTSGIETADRLFECDSVVLATGFDAMTGTLSKIAIRGRGGEALNDKWAAGPRTYLGVMSKGFPNLFFITGPGSPSVLSNMIVSIEQHVHWIADCIAAISAQDAATIEPVQAGEDAWVDHVNEVAELTVMLQANSWYLGSNVPGKPRIFMPYIGGVPVYRAICSDVAEKGYAGFSIDGSANETPVDFMAFAQPPEEEAVAA